MTTPEKIPDDVMQAAQAIASLIPSKVRDENRTFAALVIARAIMAERERCAQIADSFGIQPDPDESDPYDDYEMGGRRCARSVAAAIRIGGAA